MKIIIDLCVLNFNADKEFVYCLLLWVKLCVQRYGKLVGMLDEENEGYGLNAYNQDCEDPYSSNAIRSSIFIDVSSIVKGTQQHDVMNALCQRILNRNPLPTNLTTDKPSK